MVTPRRRKNPHPRPAGDRPTWRLSDAYLGVAAVAAAAALAWLLWPGATPPADTSAEPSPTGTTVAAHNTAPASEAGSMWPIAATVPVPREAPLPRDTRPTFEGDDDRTPDLSSYVSRGEQPTMSQVIERLHQAGIYTGLGAFNPPGTRPHLVGIAVPEGFELPEGYVRHHQATDDGQRIEAILMFAPGHVVLDANRQPIAMPVNRVVPPELAPKGMPIRTITIPAPVNS